MKNKNNLLKELKEFGLNPDSWLLEKASQQNAWLIKSRKDHEFCMRGTTNKENHWKELEWMA